MNASNSIRAVLTRLPAACTDNTVNNVANSMIQENCPPLVFDANIVPINTGINDVKNVPGRNDDRYCLALGIPTIVSSKLFVIVAVDDEDEDDDDEGVCCETGFLILCLAIEV
ncbi:hypothetical protein DERP_000780 [Dermatophagoides pteronyssinus]|uniref:Uncharacterized protein n=1 Tax=Dermatophagoides pteronyssinus TaxID=6956 RepID=A0ABQ8J166_DERPT|nr:hypothetical protein DERP_000780 [Dermatophagoides pteronyssinus]